MESRRSQVHRQSELLEAESLMTDIERRPFDGCRGYNPTEGWWITLEESKILAMNEEWWKETEPSVNVNPVPIAEGQKVWLYKSGTMYIGSWKDIRFGRGGMNRLCEVGYGITLETQPSYRRGSCYIGDFENGRRQGMGCLFWLKNSPTWKSNSLVDSQIKQSSVCEPGQQVGGLPYKYVGRFKDNHKHYLIGIATLKDGTSKVGGWVNGIIVGKEWYAKENHGFAQQEKDGVDWWTHHVPYWPIEISSPATRKQILKEKTEKLQQTKPHLAQNKRKAKTKTTPRRKLTRQSLQITAPPAAAIGNTTPAATARSLQASVNVTPDPAIAPVNLQEASFDATSTNVPRGNAQLHNSNVLQTPAPEPTPTTATATAPVMQQQAEPIPDTNTSGDSNADAGRGTATLVWSKMNRVRLKLKTGNNQTTLNRVFSDAARLPDYLKIYDDENDGIEDAAFLDIHRDYSVEYMGSRYYFEDDVVNV